MEKVLSQGSAGTGREKRGFTMEKTKTAMCLNLCTILGMAGMIWFIWYGIDNRLFVSSESLQAFLDRFGLFAPALFILIQMVQVVIPILPGAIGCLGGVLIFGPVWGFVYNYVGIAMGSVLAFLLSKHYGRPFVHHIIGEKNYNKCKALIKPLPWQFFFP